MVAHATLKLIFVDGCGTEHPQLEVPINLCTKDLSARICAEAWPSHVSLEKVDHLRLFCGGKELDMTKTLEEAKIAINPDFPTPVHVSVAEKPAPGIVTEKPTITKGADTRCSCAIL